MNPDNCAPFPRGRVVDNMPWDAYYRVDALNASFLVDLISRTPLHALAGARRDVDTESMLLGRAFHCIVLEPDRFEDRYWTVGVKPTGKGSRKEMAGLREAHAGQEFLSPEVFAKLGDMAKAVRRHPTASALLAQPGQSEVNIFWDMEGIRCKARIDRLTSSSPRVAVDLKSTRDAGDGFLRGKYGAFGLGYHLRAWFYRLGLQAVGLGVNDFKLIVVENEPPHDVRIFRFDDLVNQLAHDQVHRALPLYRKAKESGNWPGYPEGETTIMLPAYLAAELEDE